MSSQKLSIPIKGMHCKACTIVTADELKKIPGVIAATVSLKSNSAKIEYSEQPTNHAISQAIESVGYSVGYNDKQPFFATDNTVYQQFILSAAAIAIILFLLKGIGVTSLKLNSFNGNSGTLALVVGVTAGFSTCMALVGGLILGLSARYAEKHPTASPLQRFRPHLFFNAGRIITFFALGGILGLFGSVFRLNSSILGLLTIAVGIVMIILGFKLTELFPKLANKGLSLPTGLAKFLGIKKQRTKEYSHKNSFVLGGMSFFLPCGFTQAMQLVAIASGSLVTGSLVMGLFAIGTAPGLLGVGGLTSIVKGTFAKSFFRFVGVGVVLLAVYNISNGLNLMGYKLTTAKQPVTTSQAAPSQPTSLDITAQPGVAATSPAASTPRTTTMSKNPYGTNTPTVLPTVFTVSKDIIPSVFTVEVGKPYILEVDALENGQGCMSTIMIPGIYTTPLLITKGKIRLPFTINRVGSYLITCAMGIPRGTINAVKAGA